MRSIKTKISALVLTCILLTALLVGGAGVLYAKRVVAKDSVQIMNLLCRDRAQELDLLLSRIEQSVRTLKLYTESQIPGAEQMRGNPQLVHKITEQFTSLALDTAEQTDGALTVYLRFEPELAGSKAGIFYSRSSRNNQFLPEEPTDITAFEKTDVSHVGWFYQPKESGQAIWMQPYQNQNINKEMISYVAPFYAEGEFIGVVGMDIDFEVFRELVTNTRIYESGYAFLTDDEPRVMFHAGIEMGTALSQINGGEFADMAIALREESSEGTLISYTYGGVHKQGAFQSLDNGMRFVITAPVSEINAEANRLLLQVCTFCVCLILLAAAFTLLMTRRMVRPLEELTLAAERIAKGDLDVTITYQGADEVGKLSDSFRLTVTHLRNYINEIHQLAYHDTLTGLRNRTAYLEHMDQIDRRLRCQPEMAFAIAVFDINGLKWVNDTYGHEDGDKLIIGACELISRSFGKQALYRVGGDEFVAILECCDYLCRRSVVERFETSMRVADETHTLSVALGIADYRAGTDFSCQDVFKRADEAMYQRKQAMKQESPLSQRAPWEGTSLADHDC